MGDPPVAPRAKKPSSKRAFAKSRAPKEQAADLPIASVAVDIPLMQLDRPFDYLVAVDDAEAAQPGARVRVRFAGQRVDGYVLQRAAETKHEGRLSFLESVVSPEPVLTPEVFALARSVADHYVGSVADVLRLAIPPRHARVEREATLPARDRPDAPSAVSESGAWTDIVGGAALINHLAEGGAPRAVCTVPTGVAWPQLVSQAVAATLASGRTAIVVVPDHRDATRVLEALATVTASSDVVHLAAEAGPAERYRRFLAVLRGHARVVVGSRAAVFAPVKSLGLVVVYDDGDDLHAEPRAPYPHAREVAAMRSGTQNAAFLIVGHMRTAEGERLVRSRWAASLTADRAQVRAMAPEVRALGDESEDARDAAARTARIPSLAMRALRTGLESGPVLVQVPRAGYVPALRCQQCRERAECRTCSGPLRLSDAGGAPTCTWCGIKQSAWRCGTCGGHTLRASRTGAGRTAEELGRAFPGVPVVTSGRNSIIDTVPDRPALVVATPGAEPVADDGYCAVVLLDGDRLLDRPDLRAGEEAVRRWSNAVALCRTRDRGGHVVLVADSAAPSVQAMVRSDPEGFAGREFDERARAHMPPAARIATLTGEPDAVAAFRADLQPPEGTEVLGPLPVSVAPHGPHAGGHDDEVAMVRLVLRVPLAAGSALAQALRTASALRSARKATPYVTVAVDPLSLD